MTMLSKLNYRVSLNENMDITDSISFYFNLRKAHYLRLRLKQRFSHKVGVFLFYFVLFCFFNQNPAIAN